MPTPTKGGYLFYSPICRMRISADYQPKRFYPLRSAVGITDVRYLTSGLLRGGASCFVRYLTLLVGRGGLPHKSMGLF